MSASGVIVAVVRDLFFAVRIRETLGPRGYTVTVARSAEAVAQALAEQDAPPVLLIVDLAFAAIAPVDLIASVRRDPAHHNLPILAFGSHLDHAARAAAKAAGATRVIANSQLAASLPDLVARLVQPTTG